VRTFDELQTRVGDLEYKQDDLENTFDSLE